MENKEVSEVKNGKIRKFQEEEIGKIRKFDMILC